MATTPILVYCGGGNPRLYQIATTAGFRYGARLPAVVYGPIWFADQDWKRPDRRAYMAALAKHRPEQATVLDWEREEQLTEVLDWAEEASQYVDRVIVIPKVVEGIARLPRQIGGKQIMLGYSVPTVFGSTPVPVWEFAGWSVHLLGGAPQKQIRVWHHLAAIADVVSCDGNMAIKLAISRCQFWVPGTANYARNRFWPRLEEADGQRWGHDAPYEAFRRSCENIVAAWREIAGVSYQQLKPLVGPLAPIMMERAE